MLQATNLIKNEGLIECIALFSKQISFSARIFLESGVVFSVFGYYY